MYRLEGPPKLRSLEILVMYGVILVVTVIIVSVVKGLQWLFA